MGIVKIIIGSIMGGILGWALISIRLTQGTLIQLFDIFFNISEVNVQTLSVVFFAILGALAGLATSGNKRPRPRGRPQRMRR